jgi:guanine nucleotide-binding protein subunit alpha
MERITQKGYIPSVQDVLRARAMTTGITETRFTIADQLSIQYDIRNNK